MEDVAAEEGVDLPATLAAVEEEASAEEEEEEATAEEEEDGAELPAPPADLERSRARTEEEEDTRLVEPEEEEETRPRRGTRRTIRSRAFQDLALMFTFPFRLDCVRPSFGSTTKRLSRPSPLPSQRSLPLFDQPDTYKTHLPRFHGRSSSVYSRCFKHKKGQAAVDGERLNAAYNCPLPSNHRRPSFFHLILHLYHTHPHCIVL